MSRSGYTNGCDDPHFYLYRGAVASAMRGRRGQAFFKEMLAALDALPEKKLIAGEIEENGAVCAIGAVAKARGVDVMGLDPEDAERVASLFGIAKAMAREIVFENDKEWFASDKTPEARFERMRHWVVEQIVPEPRTN